MIHSFETEKVKWQTLKYGLKCKTWLLKACSVTHYVRSQIHLMRYREKMVKLLYVYWNSAALLWFRSYTSHRVSGDLAENVALLRDIGYFLWLPKRVLFTIGLTTGISLGSSIRIGLGIPERIAKTTHCVRPFLQDLGIHVFSLYKVQLTPLCVDQSRPITHLHLHNWGKVFAAVGEHSATTLAYFLPKSPHS